MTDDTITLTVEIDPSEFDEPRKMMYERLVEEYGQETIAELVGANLSQDLTARGCTSSTRCGTTTIRSKSTHRASMQMGALTSPEAGKMTEGNIQDRRESTDEKQQDSVEHRRTKRGTGAGR
jgi:hypothetical protein